MSKSKAVNEFEELNQTMEELEAFSKSMAASTPKRKPKQEAAIEEEDVDGKDTVEDEDPMMGKSTGKDAQEEMMDGEVFLKKANTMLGETVKTHVALVAQEQKSFIGMLAKALVAQGAMLKSIHVRLDEFQTEAEGLRQEAEALGKQPGMRKSQIHLHARHESAATLPHEESANGNAVVKKLLTKSLPGPGNLLESGHLTPSLVAQLEHLDNRGEGLTPNLAHLARLVEA